MQEPLARLSRQSLRGSLTLGALLLAGMLALVGCDRKTPQSASGAPPDPSAAGADSPAPPDESRQRSIVLYSSADTELVKLVTDLFEKDTGIKVRWTGDTEQTKNTGLVQRILAEKDAPKADVWWSSEPFGTIRLAREGLFESYTSKKTEDSLPGGWPSSLRAPDNSWYGFAQRARVIVYNSEKVRKSDVPRTVAGLTDPRFKGRVGLARPQFGTTGGHMAAIAQIYGDEAFRAWLKALAENRVRLYDGNMSVVRAVSTGELLVGLTDTDDVWAGQRNKWPVELAYEPNDVASSPMGTFKGGKLEVMTLGAGPLLLPNTIALLKGSKNTKDAQRFIDFVLSEKVEKLLADSDSHNIPTRPRLLADARYEKYAYPAFKMQPMVLNFEAVADLLPEALKICEEELPK